MSYLLDTMVVSELMKKNQHQGVMRWLDAQEPRLLFVSVITVGEIEQGIGRLPHGARRLAYERMVREALPARFAGRILPVSIEVASSWGVFSGRHKQTLPVVDGLIAATARVHEITVVTRNVADFLRFDVPVVNPWE
ncbi:MAG: PIN domain-containing protein [Acidiferrobacteraceae bacterium]